MPWKSGDSSKIQDCGWHLAEPMGVQPETAAAKRVGEAERRTKRTIGETAERLGDKIWRISKCCEGRMISERGENNFG